LAVIGNGGDPKALYQAGLSRGFSLIANREKRTKEETAEAGPAPIPSPSHGGCHAKGFNDSIINQAKSNQRACQSRVDIEDQKQRRSNSSRPNKDIHLWLAKYRRCVCEL
jgi:hypothetical protein